MSSEDTNRIVAAIDRNTEAITSFRRQVGSAGLWLFLLWLGICVFGCPRAKASPITYVPIAEQPLQYWHTRWVPADGGVYPQEVYAPVLPRVEPELYVFTDIGDPPRLMETPEPGTAVVVGCIVILMIIGALAHQYAKAEKRVLDLSLALIDIKWRGDEYSRDVARKALEE